MSSEYGSFTSFGRSVPRHYILFNVIVHGVISLISLSDVFLLFYRSAADFYILILYSATLVNLLMSSGSCVVAPLGFYVYRM